MAALTHMVVVSNIFPYRGYSRCCVPYNFCICNLALCWI